MKAISKAGSPSVGGHFLELDGMRGALAATVMLYHFGLNTLLAKLTAGYLDNGAWGLSVDFFFMLSGFVLCRSFVNRRIDIGSYAVKRVMRLAPMFFLTTAATLILTGAAEWSPPAILANILMVQSLIGLPSINFVSWSIPFEMFLPVIVLLSVTRIKALGIGPVIVLLVAAAIVSIWATAMLSYGNDRPWLRASGGLAAGAILYLVRDLVPSKVSGCPTTITLALFAGVMAVMAICGAVPLAAIAFTPLSLAAIWFGAEAKGVFSTVPLQALGRWSYSIYLTHPVVIIGANLVLGEGRMDGNIGLKVSAIITTLIVSSLCYRLIEAPFMALGQKMATGRRQAVAPAI